MNEKAFKIRHKVLSRHSTNYELGLLTEMCHEISNFKPGFKGKLKHTYVLDPAASSMFGFDIFYGRAFLGVPDVIFDYFMSIRWYLCNTLKDQPGIYLVFDMGIPPENHAVAIRIHMRGKRVRALEQFNTLTLIRMKADGAAFHESPENAFDLPVKQVTSLAWEKIS